MKGYKVFNPDWTCRGFQYEVGKTYEMEGDPCICERGFHFCKNLADCFSYYRFNVLNRVAEVFAHGLIVEEEKEDWGKYATNKIEIVREVPWTEVFELVNTGRGNTGFENIGDYNSGYFNRGPCNSGSYNAGYRNSGDRNSGDYNSGMQNIGSQNSGFRNRGNYNNGRYNIGKYNTGDWNVGHFNSGDYNIGNGNSGNCNVGKYNTGDWNKSSHVAGCFNTQEHALLFFDKPTDMTYKEWHASEANAILNRVNLRPGDWIDRHDMTEEKKKKYPDAVTTGGYLKKCDTRDRSSIMLGWWGELTDSEKEIIKNIPNFDAKKFEEITGINVINQEVDDERL